MQGIIKEFLFCNSATLCMITSLCIVLTFSNIDVSTQGWELIYQWNQPSKLKGLSFSKSTLSLSHFFLFLFVKIINGIVGQFYVMHSYDTYWLIKACTGKAFHQVSFDLNLWPVTLKLKKHPALCKVHDYWTERIRIILATRHECLHIVLSL